MVVCVRDLVPQRPGRRPTRELCGHRFPCAQKGGLVNAPGLPGPFLGSEHRRAGTPASVMQGFTADARYQTETTLDGGPISKPYRSWPVGAFSSRVSMERGHFPGRSVRSLTLPHPAADRCNKAPLVQCLTQRTAFCASVGYPNTLPAPHRERRFQATGSLLAQGFGASVRRPHRSPTRGGVSQ